MQKIIRFLPLVFFGIFVLSPSVSFSKSQLPDSIQIKLDKASHDTVRVRILAEQCNQIEEGDSMIAIYANAGLDIINKDQSSSFKPIYDKYKVDFLLAKGRYLIFYKGESEVGINDFNEATSLAKRLNDKPRLIKSFIGLQDLYAVSGDMKKLKPIIDSTIPLQKSIDDKIGLVNTYCNLGNYYTGTGNSDSAIISFKTGNSIALEAKDKDLEAFTYYAIGFGYLHKGSPQEALPYLYKSVKAYDEAGKHNDALFAIQAIGNVYSTQQEYSRAIAYFDTAIVLTKKSGQVFPLCNLYYYKGSAFQSLDQYDSSNYYLEKSIEVSKQLNYADVLGAATNKLGANYYYKGNHDKALYYLRESLKDKAQLPENLAESYAYIGLILLEKNKIDSSWYYAKLAEKNATSLQFNSAQRQVQLLLGKIYERKGDYGKAVDAYKKYIVYNDSISNKKTFRSAIEKQYQYEQEKKDILAKAEQEKKDIEIRAQKTRLTISIIAFAIILAMGGTLVYSNRKRKETAYKQNLAESEMKALRSQMNPHFMFNSLNAIQKMVLNNENDRAFKYLDTYSKLTRRILENSEKKWIPLQDEIKFLELYLEIESLRFQHAFTYEMKVDENISVHEDQIPAMIIQPLVENAIKHGLLPKDGDKKLLIEFKKPVNNSQLEVIVEDNGVGRKVATENKIKSEHQSMSLAITETRLHLLDETGNSKITIEDLTKNGSEISCGTRVTVIVTQPE